MNYRSVKRKHWQRVICWALIALLMTPVLTAFEVQEGATAGEYTASFENFDVGAMDGQFGWQASSGVTVTDAVYTVSGTKSVKIVDASTTTAEAAAYEFAPIEAGFVEWWAKAETTNRMVMLLEQNAGDVKQLEWFGFTNYGNFEYFDGTERIYTEMSYSLNQWYRFRIDFNAAEQKKTIYIFDDQDLLLLKKDTAFKQTEIASANRLRFVTMSNRTGTFYVDNVRIRDEASSGTGPLQALHIYPSTIQLPVSQSVEVNVLGEYAYSGLKALDVQPVLISHDSAIASIENNQIIGVSAGETVISTTYEGAYGQADVIIYDDNDVPPHKTITPRTLTRPIPLEGLTIVAPEDTAWTELGSRLADGLTSLGGADIEVVAPDETKFEHGWSGNTLLLGSLGNNWQISRLYGMQMSYADAVYPGAGGYRLQTIVDPFGMGGNTLLVTASDLNGAEAAVDRLLARVSEGADTAIPWLAEARLSQQAQQYFEFGVELSEEDKDALLAEADVLLSRLTPTTGNEEDANALYELFKSIAAYGEYYLLSADPGMGEVYRKTLKGYANFVNAYPAQAQDQLNFWRNMWTSSDALINNWTVLEASPIFSTLDRKQIISALYLTFEANSVTHYLTAAEETGARYNHEVFPALSIVVAADYFQRYHHLPEAEEWRAIGDRIFMNNTTLIGLDEGSDYLMHVPMTNIDYGMAIGDLTYLTRTLRPSADLNAMMMNNLGTMAGGGDTYPFGYSNAYSWGHSQVMNAAAWFYGNPLYQYLLEKTNTGAFPGQKMGDLDYPIHRYMAYPTIAEEPSEEEMPKISAYPMDQGIYDHVLENGEVGVSLEDAFHKLAFRSGFDTDDSYLVLDGFSAGAHGHQDGNAILEYSANGRIFLTDRDYIEKTPQHHSGIVIVKDGVQLDKPPFAELEWAADVDGQSLSRSKVPAYNGMDWDRTVFSPDGKYYLIVDDLTAEEAGDYLLQNTWQALGSASIVSNRFEIEQDGVNMMLQSLDYSDLRTHERYGHFLKYWKSDYPYPYADTETVLTEVNEERTYAPGDTSRFINVLSSHNNGEQAVNARRVNEQTVQLRSEGSASSWAVMGTVAADNLASNAKFHWMDNDSLFAAGVTELSVNGELLTFSEPVIFRLNAANGQWTAYRAKKEILRYDASGEPVRETPVQEGTADWGSREQSKLIRDVTRPDRPSDWRKERKPAAMPYKNWRNIADLGEGITHSSSGDVDGDGMDDLIVGHQDGTVTAINRQGVQLWSFPAAGRINEVSIQIVDGVPIVFAATENWHLHAIDANGEELWNREFPSDPAHAERKGNLLGITNVRVAHVNGDDSEPLIMVGTQYRYLYGLNASGEVVSESVLSHYGIDDMAFADADGDGREEGIIGMEYNSYVYWNEGSSGRAGGADGPGWKVIDAIPDWADEGRAAFFLGTKQNQVHWVVRADSGLQQLWRLNVGGEVNDLMHGDYDRDGTLELLAGTDGYQLYVIRDDGTVQFRRTLGGRVLHVNGWDRDGQGLANYIAADDQGVLYMIQSSGELMESVRFRAGIVGIPVSDGHQHPWVVLENGEVYIRK
ncbi:heparinase II/III-family protein [Paenibacillus sp. J5C_2022]|nr:heparinase II/III-family protein [Paenibacillus sp. J5C2022]